MEMLHIVIGYFFLATIAAGDGKHFICKEVEDIFVESQTAMRRNPSHTLQGRPGKRGSIGAKGETGDIGPPGPPSEVNYTLIESRVKESLFLEYELLSGKMRDLVGMVNELSVVVKKLTSENCELLYAGRCYHFILQNPATFEAGRELCQRIGWKLANVYGRVHYEILADYLRKQLQPSQSIIVAWLGMTINPSTKLMRYSNGTAASSSGFTWYPGYPYSNPTYTKIGIHINKNPGSGSQGIHSFPPSGTRHGSVCEI